MESKSRPLTLPSKNSLRQELLLWYRRYHRSMPWRDRPSPYRTWISEIMLQQTTVAFVIPYFERFIKKFPDVRSLAGAKEEEVLSLWAGLGYYSRARNLLLAAQKIVRHHRGIFPDDFDSLISLPGIGRYSAGAILSIAFQKPYPVLDGNVSRVFSRLTAQNKTPEEWWKMAEDLLDRDHPGDWNQALMELGATVCAPENPRCKICPVSFACAALKTKTQNLFPAPKIRKNIVKVNWNFLWIERNGKVLLWNRGEKEKLLKRHWGLPEMGKVHARVGSLLKTASHMITHHQINVQVYQGSLKKEVSAPMKWVPRSELPKFLVSSLWKKCLPKAN